MPRAAHLMPEAGQSLHQINGVAQVEVVSVAPEEGVPQLPENKLLRGVEHRRQAWITHG